MFTVPIGKVFFDGIYGGNSSRKDLVWEKGQLYFYVNFDDLTDENLAQFAQRRSFVDVKFVGVVLSDGGVNFSFKGQIVSRKMCFAGDRDRFLSIDHKIQVDISTFQIQSVSQQDVRIFKEKSVF